jgi:hypothetical protein
VLTASSTLGDASAELMANHAHDAAPLCLDDVTHQLTTNRHPSSGSRQGARYGSHTGPRMVRGWSLYPP